ncbi:hypothetical protein ABE82_26505 (plasmid) [Paenibacillus peoriae]|uniref:hypothetical protein n=1 Tax=Paenibacillus peoriae TaxID=59893 RepID=UPI0007212420|nr:hypothetical protein [Paenibacillus peoriae]ALS09967.1 hypothetical protein ABE82_26505 [Paenibacillus peoriae]
MIHQSNEIEFGNLVVDITKSFITNSSAHPQWEQLEKQLLSILCLYVERVKNLTTFSEQHMEALHILEYHRRWSELSSFLLTTENTDLKNTFMESRLFQDSAHNNLKTLIIKGAYDRLELIAQKELTPGSSFSVLNRYFLRTMSTTTPQIKLSLSGTTSSDQERIYRLVYFHVWENERKIDLTLHDESDKRHSIKLSDIASLDSVDTGEYVEVYVSCCGEETHKFSLFYSDPMES